MLFVQGVAEVVRCVMLPPAAASGRRALHDVEELETAILHEQEAKRERGRAAQAKR